MTEINIFTNKGDFFAKAPKAPFLGIDWGMKRIGIAVSDDTLVLASPLETIHRIEDLDAIITARKIGAFVLGYPLEMSGNIGKKAKEVEAFAAELSKRYPELPILLEDERLTSYEAERMMIEELNLSRKKRKGNIDRAAAALILQGVLDAKGNFK